MFAVLEGHENIVEMISASSDIEINHGNVDGTTALMVGADKGNSQIVKILLKHPKIDVNKEDIEGDNALIWAVDKGHHEILNMLTRRKDLEASEKNLEQVMNLLLGNRPLDVESLTELVAKAVKDSYQEIASWILRSQKLKKHFLLDAVFLNSAQEGYFEIMKILLEKTLVSSINVADDNNVTALIHAVNSKKAASYKIAEFLVKNGCDVNQRGAMGTTSLHTAVQKKRYDIIDLLRIKSNADFNLLGEKQHSPLILAAGSNDTRALSSLLKKKDIDVNGKGFMGKSPLIWASENGHTECVKMLMKETVEINMTDADGYTSLMWASDNGHVEVVKALLEHPKINVNVIDTDGHSALTWAADRGHQAVVEALLTNAKINCNIIDNDYYSPLICASRNGLTDIVSTLLEDTRVDVNIKVQVFKISIYPIFQFWTYET